MHYFSPPLLSHTPTQEEVVLVNVLTALGFLLPGIEVERNIIARVVSLLGSQVSVHVAII
jgi:hypothetical protein